MFREKLKGNSLWAWTAAAASAPGAQLLGSASWIWIGAAALLAGLLWHAAAGRTEGRSLPRPLAAAEFLFLALVLAGAAGLCGECWITAEHRGAFPAVLLVLGASSAAGGCRAGARCGAVLFHFLASLFLLLTAFAIPEARLQWLVPRVQPPAGGAMLALLLPACSLLLPRAKGERPGIWALGLALSALGASLLTAAVLSPQGAAASGGAYFRMMRGVSIFGVAERFEAVISAAMTLGWFCLMSLLLTAAGRMADTVRSGWGLPGVWLCAGLAWVGSLLGLSAFGWVGAGAALVLWLAVPLAAEAGVS